MLLSLVQVSLCSSFYLEAVTFPPRVKFQSLYLFMCLTVVSNKDPSLILLYSFNLHDLVQTSVWKKALIFLSLASDFPVHLLLSYFLLGTDKHLLFIFVFH